MDDKERVVCMEEGENRKINLEAMTTKTLVVVSDDWFRYITDLCGFAGHLQWV